jgi:RimJ/RimL family protein N-acetyltransferase
MPNGTTAAYLLGPEHAAQLQRLLGDAPGESDPRVVELAREGAVAAFIERAVKERLEGLTYSLAILDRGAPVGVALVREVAGPAGAIVDCWVAPPLRRRGLGGFGIAKALELAFQNLQLPRVRARASEEPAVRRVLERAGFAPGGDDELELTRERWLERRDAPALARLHPALKSLLQAELDAGNEVLETGGGWPDADSVFVRVKYPFRARPAALPGGVDYQEPNDPHWWRADYSTRGPRHILAC